LDPTGLAALEQDFSDRPAAVWEDQVCVLFAEVTRKLGEMFPVCNSLIGKGFLPAKKFVIVRDRVITSCVAARPTAMLSSQTSTSSVTKPSSMQLGMQQERC